MSAVRVTRNAAFAVGQAVSSALLLLLTYRLLMDWLKIEEIGLWALVIGTTSVARLTEFGMGAGVLRFVAADLGAENPARAARTLGMAAISVGLFVSLLAFALYPWLEAYLVGITPEHLHGAVAVLLPASLIGLVLGTLANVFCNAIDGCQRMDLRVGLQVSANLVQFATTWAVLPARGLDGLGMVQIAQSGFMLVSAMGMAAWLLRRPLRDYLGFERARLGELFRYGGGLQISSIAQLLYEPLLKVLLTNFSGLALTGYFDMANRIVQQFRSVIVAAYSALVPHVAARSGRGKVDAQEVRVVYREAFDVLNFLVVPYFACVAAAMPLALTLWKGQFEPMLLGVAMVQLVGWLLNTINVPAYLIFVGLGRLRWNIASHLSMGLMTLAMGPALGWLIGGKGVLAAGFCALGGGSLLVLWAFHREFEQPWDELWDRRRLPMRLLLAGAIAASVAVAARGVNPGWPVLLGLPLGCALMAAGLAWQDPARARLLRRFEQALGRPLGR